MPITEPGAWSPLALQRKFPDHEPWFIDDGSFFDDEPTEEEVAQIKEIGSSAPGAGTTLSSLNRSCSGTGQPVAAGGAGDYLDPCKVIPAWMIRPQE